MSQRLSRRSFVLVSGGAVALPALMGGCSRSEDVASVRTVVESLKGEPGVMVIGQGSRHAPLSVEALAARIRSLGPSRWFWEEQPTLGELLHHIIRDEFRRGRVVERQGWILAETEAELYATAAAEAPQQIPQPPSESREDDVILNESEEGDE